MGKGDTRERDEPVSGATRKRLNRGICNGRIIFVSRRKESGFHPTADVVAQPAECPSVAKGLNRSRGSLWRRVAWPGVTGWICPVLRFGGVEVLKVSVIESV